MMNFIYIFIALLLINPTAVKASEEIDPLMSANNQLDDLAGQLNQTPGASLPQVQIMDNEDIGFDDEIDAFATEPNSDILPTVPMIQKSNKTSTPLNKTTPDESQVMIPVITKPEPVEDKSKEKLAPISKNQTLTETLQSQEKEKLPTIPIPDVSGTWVDKLAGSVPLPGENKSEVDAIDSGSPIDSTNTANYNLRNLVDNSRQSSSLRSNASVFDVSGIMLRMTLNQAEKAMLVRGFKKLSQSYEIPNFIKWRNEEKCRNNGVVGYERVNNCMVEVAKKDNHQYVETVKYSKFSTKETVEIKLTSNFTNNKVYRVMYKSTSGKVIGSGAKAAYLRNIKVFDFWKKVNQKYGTPDSKEDVTWGLGGNKPYLKAATGFLILEDPMLRELDYTRMSREDQRFMNTDLYSF